MRLLMISLILSLGIGSAFAAPAKKSQQSRPKGSNTEYSTSLSFEGAAIKGKVQTGSLRKIVVENDKSLDDLLGVRRHFDDREQTEKGRVTSW